MKPKLASQGQSAQGLNFSVDDHRDFETLNSLQIEHKSLIVVAKKIFETMTEKFVEVLDDTKLPEGTDICVSDYSLKDLPTLLNQFLETFKNNLDPKELFSASGPGGEVTRYEKTISELNERVEVLRKGLAQAEKDKEEKEKEIVILRLDANNSAEQAYRMKILDLYRKQQQHSNSEDAVSAEAILDMKYEDIEGDEEVIEDMRQKLKEEIKKSTGSLSKYTYFFIKETARIKKLMDDFYEEGFEPFAEEVTKLLMEKQLTDSYLNDRFESASGKVLKSIVYAPTFRKIAFEFLRKAKEKKIKLKAASKSQLKNLTSEAPEEHQCAAVFCKLFMTLESFHIAVNDKFFDALVEQKIIPKDWNRLSFHYLHLRRRESALSTPTLTPQEAYQAKNLVWDSDDDEEDIDNMRSEVLESVMSEFSSRKKGKTPQDDNDESSDPMDSNMVRSVNKTPHRGYISWMEMQSS
jgi:hypothetical protein